MQVKIGIIGSGNVGGVLGSRWAASGHNVVFSSCTPDSAEMKQLVAAAGPNARAATAMQTVADSDVILLSTPWPATQGALAAAGSLAGKILIHATNPLLPNLAGIEFGTTTSGAEHVATWAPGARVVKAFNTIGNNIMADPLFDGKSAALLYCGDDPEAKAAVRQLATDLGFDPHDSGPLTQARVLEPAAMLWISMAVFHGYGREFAFGLMSR